MSKCKNGKMPYMNHVWIYENKYGNCFGGRFRCLNCNAVEEIE